MGPYVPPGQSPPFEVIDDLHHGGLIIISTALGLVVSLACFLIRLYVRLMLIPPFARDDFVLLGATVFGVIQSILVFYACSKGFGTSISLLKEHRLNQIQALISTSDAFALLVIYLSKCCVIAIYLRLTPQKPHNKASWATFALCTAWLIPAIFILLIDCELNKPWRLQGGHCHNLYKRWQFIAAVDIITELIIFVLAVALLQGLFMSIKRKLGIGFAFIFRFPLIICTLLHLCTLKSALKDNDITFAAVRPTMWLQAEMHYSLVACSVFCLRPFMAAVSTNYGTAGDSNLESSASASRSRETKGSSNSNSNSKVAGSNSASRSGSFSRVRRKRAGTSVSRVFRSGSKEELCRDHYVHGGVGDGDMGYLDTGRDGLKRRSPGPGQSAKECDVEVQAPMRRSLFPLTGADIKTDKGKVGGKGTGSLLEFEAGSDCIELMPQLHRQYGRPEETASTDGEDPEKMVIRKDVAYSVEYEYDEERPGQKVSKQSSTDAMAYV
ncbi:hypothetical protein N7493_001127 [Penicillium malachiteum]|uniref:Rhodopsin domain-containing protein n=1 Tax=Penicillium malachiteum TaxID=1324776 RepID=A0AAD6MZK5_9EURO|nr:hypothetical protein N7493_001127 [Penicillium malachiteum]